MDAFNLIINEETPPSNVSFVVFCIFVNPKMDQDVDSRTKQYQA